MSTGSQAAVTSPLMSTTAVFSPTRRTSIVIAGAPISSVLPLVLLLLLGPGRGSGGRVGELADVAVEIGKALDEVRQPRHVPHLQFAWSAGWCAAGRPLLCPSRRPCCG